MSTILNVKLVTELTQDLNLNGNERVHVAGFFPYLLVFNSPSGTFTFSVIRNTEILYSKSFTSTDIKTSLSTTDNYAHVFYPIIPDNPMQLERGLYTFKISASGYTASDSSYLGWIQQFENLQTDLDYTATNSTFNPLAIRIKAYKRG